jgi:hypothetical protein
MLLICLGRTALSITGLKWLQDRGVTEAARHDARSHVIRRVEGKPSSLAHFFGIL